MVGLLSEQEKKIIVGALMGVDLTEVYSPARITEVCSKSKLVPGGHLIFKQAGTFPRQNIERTSMQTITIKTAPKIYENSHRSATHVTIKQNHKFTKPNKKHAC